jgi:hypothetical protein
MSTRRVASSAASASRAQQVLELHAHLLHALGREQGDAGRRATAVLELDLDVALVEGPLAQHAPELLARGVFGFLPRSARRWQVDDLGRLLGRHARLLRCGDGRRQQGVEHALLGPFLRLGLHRPLLLLEHEGDAELCEVANDGLHVATHVAHLRELRGLDLEEWSLGHPRQAPRHLGLAHSRRPDHDDVLGCDLVAQLLGHLLAAPAVAQRDRDGTLRLRLAHDVAVQLGDDFARSEGLEFALGAHGSSTTVTWSLV